jgi:uncharacterized membrane protein YgdD (TMEM256/DUF423 family)
MGEGPLSWHAVPVALFVLLNGGSIDLNNTSMVVQYLDGNIIYVGAVYGMALHPGAIHGAYTPLGFS